MKYSQKNPRTDSFYWTGTVLSVGREAFCEEEARNARLQVTESNGNVSFIPIVRREDPDMTSYQNVSQILLNEDLVQPSAKKIKLITSSQPESALVSAQEEAEDNVNGQTKLPQDMYTTLNPEEVTELLVGAEKRREISDEPENGMESSGILYNKELDNSDHLTKRNDNKLDKPKYSSTPANRKFKKVKTINPEDIAEMEYRRADLEAVNAIRESAEKITQAAVMIVNCMEELKPEIKSLANRNYREIQMSTNAVKQLVRNFIEIFLKTWSKLKDNNDFF